jgi:hypothetical protein
LFDCAAHEDCHAVDSGLSAKEKCCVLGSFEQQQVWALASFEVEQLVFDLQQAETIQSKVWKKSHFSYSELEP